MLPMFPPMLAQVAEQPFDRPDWQFEVKWDGMRALAYVETGGTPAVFPKQSGFAGPFSRTPPLAPISERRPGRARWGNRSARPGR